MESKTLATSGMKNVSPVFLAVKFKREDLSKIPFLLHARQKTKNKRKKIAQEINSS